MAAQFGRLEQADNAVFAIIAGVADHLAGAQARDAFGQERGFRAGDVLDRDLFQNRKLRAEARQQPLVVALDRLAGRPAGGDLREYLRQRHQAETWPRWAAVDSASARSARASTRMTPTVAGAGQRPPAPWSLA